MTEPDRSLGVYGIGVAADMVGTGVQNLRAYERAGLIQPDRTPGGTRLYSQDDIADIERIRQLLDEGLNLAGVAKVMQLEAANRALRDELDGRTSDDGAPEDPPDGQGRPRPR